jgi:hypothetical protein
MKVSRFMARESVARLSRQAVGAGLRRLIRKAVGYEITAIIFMPPPMVDRLSAQRYVHVTSKRPSGLSLSHSPKKVKS